MKSTEVKQMFDRVTYYQRLEKRANQLRMIIDTITEDDPTGPNGSGPFTGDWRESRKIESLLVRFTRTQGGSPPVTLDIGSLFIDAPSFGRHLEELLKKQLETIQAEMEKI